MEKKLENLLKFKDILTKDFLKDSVVRLKQDITSAKKEIKTKTSVVKKITKHEN